MKRTMILTLPGEIIFTRVVSQTTCSVAALLTGKSLSASDGNEFTNAFELAISEAFTNSVLHSACQCEPQTITITFTIEPRQLTVSIHDLNPPFSIDTPDPDIENYPENGYGLLIIRKVMDKVTYNRENGSNIITMSKQL
ncbi:MAG: ATP-binding protein [Chlorobiaceae bacterium]|jgi:serine/threonine-protein kinase RsbW|nr:ATP-binding protein [Chlorobiaceae bacterium]